VADGRVKGVHFLMKKNAITEYDGWGTFTDPNTLSVELSDGGEETVTFDNAILATGATTRLLPGTELGDRVVTYEEQIMTPELPASMIIAGAGAIGVEFAYVLTNYGVDVTIVEFLDRMVPLEDEEVSAELAKRYKKLGVKVLTSTRVDAIEDTGSGPVKVTVTKGDEQQVLEADKVLQAIGFAPRVDGYGLDKAGVELTDRGAVAIDDRMRTNVSHIYAIGDVTAKLMLAHLAEAMGVVAAETIAGAETMSIDYAMVPRATYCQPQIASFGYTEAQAKERGHDLKVAKFPFTANGKAHGLGDPGGFVKIVADAEHGEFLGAHLIGPDVTELLPELTLAQQWDLTAAEVARNIHAHPTLTEAIKEAVHGIAGHMINF
jgi:dihydrolipoamide dehydrogenase